MKSIPIRNKIHTLNIFVNKYNEYTKKLHNNNEQSEGQIPVKNQISLFKLLIERFCFESKIKELEQFLKEKDIFSILEIISLTTDSTHCNFTGMCQLMNITMPQSESSSTNPFSNVAAKYLPYGLILMLNNKNLKNYDEYMLSCLSHNSDAIESFIDKLLRTEWIIHFFNENDLDRTNTILKRLLGNDISTFCSLPRNLFLLKRIDVINATDFSSQFIQKLEGYNDFDKINKFYKAYHTLLQSNGFQHYLGTQDQDSDDEDSKDNIQTAIAPYMYSNL